MAVKSTVTTCYVAHQIHHEFGSWVGQNVVVGSISIRIHVNYSNGR
jgi:hypothetical protein